MSIPLLSIPLASTTLPWAKSEGITGIFPQHYRRTLGTHTTMACFPGCGWLFRSPRQNARSLQHLPARALETCPQHSQAITFEKRLSIEAHNAPSRWSSRQTWWHDTRTSSRAPIVSDALKFSINGAQIRWITAVVKLLN